MGHIQLKAEFAEFALWWSMPRVKRDPKTMVEFAEKYEVDVQTLYRWRKSGEFRDKVDKLIRDGLWRRLPDIYDALADTAVKKDGRSHSDRKLALEMAGHYVPGLVLGVDDKTSKILEKALAPWSIEPEAETESEPGELSYTVEERKLLSTDGESG